MQDRKKAAQQKLGGIEIAFKQEAPTEPLNECFLSINRLLLRSLQKGTNTTPEEYLFIDQYRISIGSVGASY
ncbi:hypothetical protein G7092_20475 [Mucilaginibacter sp. HC2]|uniref:hypothetical protein n=1 Tax=Mucilaginibacter inviolabilis TaxID=2714892 RepID=UPI001409F98A|nr:hypothetical protein [Mucilaginibacter inviolabilis]NHA06196.1 hypothetical protein [Mucilaginibacter inviolabilis]